MKRNNEIKSSLGEVFLLHEASGIALNEVNLKTIKNSIKNDCFKFIYGPEDTLIGYVSWASISRSSYRKIKVEKIDLQYDYEWNEGPISYVQNIFIINGWSHYGINFLHKERKCHKLLFWKRKDRQYLVKRVKIRSSNLKE